MDKFIPRTSFCLLKTSVLFDKKQLDVFVFNGIAYMQLQHDQQTDLKQGSYAGLNFCAVDFLPQKVFYTTIPQINGPVINAFKQWLIKNQCETKDYGFGNLECGFAQIPALHRLESHMSVDELNLSGLGVRDEPKKN